MMKVVLRPFFSLLSVLSGSFHLESLIIKLLTASLLQFKGIGIIKRIALRAILISRYQCLVVGKDELKEIVVGVLAVFDGHGGKEASEMASNYLLDYFLLHVIFCTYKQSMLSVEKRKLVSQNKNNTENDTLTLGSSPGGLAVTDDIHVCNILKEALLGAIHDIDMKFSLEALKNKYVSGSTATVVLLLDGDILVANVGDSKALLCSYENHPVTKLSAKELTRDHHPSRDDEKARIEAAGGFVRVWGVPRVNGILAVSRSIGDIYLKR
ncbi:hypothetical protein AgCh_034782 [Apium graveolens]